MALNAPPANERKRVKVYELKNNDWYDRGTGFCSGSIVSPPTAPPEALDARIVVVSEEDGSRTLLETRITKDDGYQKQQDTLIVWTESNGIDMALSFQEPEGCASIWDFVSEVQGRLSALGPGDDLSDDLLDPMHPITLQDPQLGKLDEIEGAMRAASTTAPGRDALAKFIMSPEQMYIMKLAPLVDMAEDLESLPDLHRLCNIMKTLILLNDTSIIEFAVTDQAIMGVVGALECKYDPDFPSHKANHRQYLSDSNKFKQIVTVQDSTILKKIHYTYRLLYLKDVVLARILDDPTFSVLNSLIFFHQVDIVNHFQQNQAFMQELFDILNDGDADEQRKRDAVFFLKDLCAVAKNIQAQSRNQLYQGFVAHGLLEVLPFAMRNPDTSMRVAGTDIMVALIDHDSSILRNHIYQQFERKTPTFADMLVELVLVETDLGVKAQMSDAVKIMLDTQSMNASVEMMSRNVELIAKQRANGAQQGATGNPQAEEFVNNFYNTTVHRLFGPLKALENREDMSNLTVQETTLLAHLVEMLSFFVRQHHYKSKYFILHENMHKCIGQMLLCPQKYTKLTALKWFRTCVGLHDEFHIRQLILNGLFDLMLNTVYETMGRDSLLNSMCLDLFDFIRRDGVKQVIVHLVENYREKLMGITYVNIFQGIVLRYDQWQAGYAPSAEDSVTTQDDNSQRMINGRFGGLKEMDQSEEAYFDADDDVDLDEEAPGLPTKAAALPNGANPMRPLVNYPEDDEEDAMDLLASSPDAPKDRKSNTSSGGLIKSGDDTISTDSATDEEDERRGRDRTPVSHEGSPGQRLEQSTHEQPQSIKRRREADDDEEDELSKLRSGGSSVKRRNSSITTEQSHSQPAEALNESPTQAEGLPHIEPGHGSNGNNGQQTLHGQTLRRKGSLRSKGEGSTGKFSIKPVSINPVKSAGERQDGDDGG